MDDMAGMCIEHADKLALRDPRKCIIGQTQKKH